LYLLDSDAAKKICQYLLLNELADALSSSLNDFAVLPQLKFQLKLAHDAKALAKLGTQEAVELARRLVSEASEVEVSAETANMILELNRPDIDSGEATLFAALHVADEASLVSGDKRAFVALSKIDDHPIVDALWVRLICLEEAMYLILQTTDFQQVSDKVRAHPEVDTTLSIVFGRVSVNERPAVVQALHSYMQALVNDTSGKYLLPE